MNCPPTPVEGYLERGFAPGAIGLFSGFSLGFSSRGGEGGAPSAGVESATAAATGACSFQPGLATWHLSPLRDCFYFILF